MNQHRKCVQQRCHLCQLRDSVVVFAVEFFCSCCTSTHQSLQNYHVRLYFIAQNCKFQFCDEFSKAEKCYLYMTVTALFPVTPPTVDGSHDFLLFLMLCQNFLGDLRVYTVVENYEIFLNNLHNLQILFML